MKRHHVILGTKTTAGGEVTSAGSMRSLNGVKLALEGDKISCPACKSEGVIRCHGPRIPEAWNGINFALEHDLCICGCKTPPTMLAGQPFSAQTVDGDWDPASAVARMAGSPAPAAGTAPEAAAQGLPPHTLEIRIVDADEQSPMSEPLILFDESGAEHKVTAASGAARVNDFKPGAARFIQPQRTEESA